jgi:hypothetical protein
MNETNVADPSKTYASSCKRFFSSCAHVLTGWRLAWNSVSTATHGITSHHYLLPGYHWLTGWLTEWLLNLLLALASTVVLGSEYHGTHGDILLSDVSYAVPTISSTVGRVSVAAHSWLSNPYLAADDFFSYHVTVYCTSNYLLKKCPKIWL